MKTIDNAKRLVGRVLRRLGEARDSLELGRPRRMDLEFSHGLQATGLPTRRPGDVLRELLRRSEQQSRDQAEREYFLMVLDRLLPDQARILAALSDGSVYPLLQVQAGSLLGFGMHSVLECVSSVGKNAGVLCPELTPCYVQGLQALGLVEINSVETDELTKYELLETETVVRATMDLLKKSGKRSRIVRQTLRISPMGTRLWAACRLSGEMEAQ